MCQMCERPPCVQVCPVTATYRTDDGPIAIDQSICIGCRMCMAACPYGVRTFNWNEPVAVPEEARHDGPDLQIPQVPGTRRQVRQLRPPRKGGGELPACVSKCGMEAVYIGDLVTERRDQRSRDGRSSRSTCVSTTSIASRNTSVRSPVSTTSLATARTWTTDATVTSCPTPTRRPSRRSTTGNTRTRSCSSPPCAPPSTRASASRCTWRPEPVGARGHRRLRLPARRWHRHRPDSTTRSSGGSTPQPS